MNPAPPALIPQPQTEASGSQPNKGIRIDELAMLPEKTLIDEALLASIFRVTSRTIRRMVDRSELPEGFPLAGRSFWFTGDVLAHIDRAAKRASRKTAKREMKIRELSP